jgi:hypothetical protein
MLAGWLVSLLLHSLLVMLYVVNYMCNSRTPLSETGLALLP